VDDVPEPAPVTQGPMPTSTRVAVVLLALLGILLLLNAASLWVAQEAVVDQLSGQSGADPEQSAQQLLLFLIAYAVIGLSGLLAAGFLPARRTWARQVGILVTSLLVVMTLFTGVVAGGMTPISLLVLVSAAAGLAGLLSRRTRNWLNGTVCTD
jgi:hypothetical protein